MKDEFNYWAREHYDFKIVSGSEATCMGVFRADQEKYPTMQYATHISFKSYKEPNTKCKIIIKRFKTKELCKKHTEYPPTYIREGKVL